MNGKVAIVTGASGGIGRATAKLLSEKGARVVAAARSTDKLESLVEELPDALAVPTDMTDPVAIEALVQHTQTKYGAVDILVNNAGRGMGGTVEEIDLDAFRDIFELNIIGVVAAMQAAIPFMRGRGGSIVNISSGLTKTYVPGTGPYSATKYALNALTLISRAELAKDGIAVSLVHPWITETDFFTNASTSHTRRDGQDGLAPADTPEYVAGLILHAIESGEAEVMAEAVKASMSSGG